MATSKPHAVQIVDVRNGLFLRVEALREILLRDEIQEKNVCVISIAGAFRQGKSFLLNFFIRYLTIMSDARADLTGWLNPESEPISGFSAKGGSNAVTAGILIWSKVFLRKLPSGEEVAIILMDTQGTFDNESTLKTCTEVFALSTLISSVQIYNMKDNIKKCDLDYLKLFVEYGRQLQKSGSRFQNLLFLVRDWTYPEEKPYGMDGGKLLLDHVLKIEGGEIKEENLSLRRDIRGLFDRIDCFLLPHPGLKVPKFNYRGELKDIEEDFKIFVEILVSTILSPENLIPKVINKKRIKVKHLVNFFQCYCDQFKDESIPKLKSFSEAVTSIQLMMALEEAEAVYDREMAFVKNCNMKSMTDKELMKEHSRSKNMATDYFENKRVFGGQDKKITYKAKLEKFLEEKFEIYSNWNKHKQQLEHQAKMEQQIREQEEKINSLGEQITEEIKSRMKIKEEHEKDLRLQKERIEQLQRELKEQKEKCIIL